MRKISITESQLKFIIRESISELQLYHGSCADFDKFDDKFVLTGVGQMAHGYGFYLTNNVESARSYAMGGKLYTVEVPDGKYLNSDRISPKEAAIIARKFFNYFLATEYGREAYGENPKEFWDAECCYIENSLGGSALYGTIASILGSDKATSEYLHSLGYVGMVINSSNGTTGEKFKNYLIFDKDDIKILSKTDFK